MVRTLQSELLKQEQTQNTRNFDGCYVGTPRQKKRRGQFAMQLCSGRIGKSQEAGYRYDQTAEYVRSRIG